MSDSTLQLTMQRLRTADKTHGGHAETEPVEALLGSSDNVGMISEAEIIVRAQIDDAARPARRGDFDPPALWSYDEALPLVEPIRLNVLQDVG
jgi:hypothetical protein